jgi:hypothetical protein
MKLFNAVANMFFALKKLKKKPQKLLRKTQIHYFFLTASTAQMAQTEEFMFQNVAYRPTVYRTGLNKNKVTDKKNLIKDGNFYERL